MYKTVTFQGWTGGEYGAIHSREAGRRKEMFHSDNMVRNRDALLVPRAGMRQLDFDLGGPDEIYAGGFGSDGMWLLLDDDVKSYAIDWTDLTVTGPTTYTGAHPTFTPLYPLESAGALSVTYLIAPGEDVWKLNHVAHTVTAISGGLPDSIPPGRCATFYQNRLLVAGDGGSNAATLYFSGVEAYETFTPGAGTEGGFIAFPDLGAITSIDPYRTGVMIGGLSGKFVYITGTLGFSEVARYVTFQGAPADPTKRANLATNEILYMADQRPYMETYNGALHQTYRDLTFAGRNFVADTLRPTPAFKAVKLIGPDDWMVCSGLTGELSFAAAQRMMLHYEGVATWHTWEQAVGSMVWHQGAGRQILAAHNELGWALFVWDTELDRPAFTTDVLGQPGDGTDDSVTAFVWLPQLFPEDGTNINVTELLVDFRKWDTGITDSDFYNHFDVSVRAVNRYGTRQAPTVDPKVSAVQSFDEDPALVSDDPLVAAGGVDQRIAFKVGDQGWGAGFEVHVDNVRGVGLRSVTVVYDDEPRR